MNYICGKLAKTSVFSNTRFLGLAILFLVNLLWVFAGEISRHIFVDLKFERPFFLTYFKLCMLISYMLRYLSMRSLEAKRERNCPTALSNGVGGSDLESLTPAEFEKIALSEESDVETIAKASKQVRFSNVCEVRHMPLSLAEEALHARLPYNKSKFWSYVIFPPQFRHTFLLAFMWIVCSLTYQASLLFISVSSLNLISSSSSLFILILSAICPLSASDYFTWTKLLLITCNFTGVALVSEYSLSSYGTLLALFSAFCYAVYLVYFSYLQIDGSQLDTSLVMGMVGVLTVLVCTPLLFLSHYLSIEPLLPLPNWNQFIMLLLNGVIGTLFSDFLWLYAASLTSSLAASISLSMCIPMSFLADFLFRSQPPSVMKLIAAVPIIISFLGATLLNPTPGVKIKKFNRDLEKLGVEEEASLINEFGDSEEEQL